VASPHPTQRRLPSRYFKPWTCAAVGVTGIEVFKLLRGLRIADAPKADRLQRLALVGRGLPSFTSQLNLSAFCGIGGLLRDCVAHVNGVLEGVQGV